MSLFDFIILWVMHIKYYLSHFIDSCVPHFTI